MENFNYDAKNPCTIKVIGVGGGGSNAVARMYNEGLQDVELYIVNTDLQHLNSLPVPNKIHIGENITKGRGAGSKPELGEAAAKENIEEIKSVMEGADMVFIAAGLGGGTGTGAAPVIAEAAKEMGILTVAVVTKPFNFEGKIRAQLAEEGLNRLKEKVDTYIVIHNQRILSIAGRNLAFSQAFKLVDDILYRAVKGITDLVLVPGLINADFADIKTIMENGGKALIGVGSGKGENKIAESVLASTTSPLLEDTTIDGARRLIINIEVSPDLSIVEVEEAVSQIKEKAHEDAHIIFGASMSDSLDNEMKITVIATDFAQEKSAELKPKEAIKTRLKTKDKKEEKTEDNSGIKSPFIKETIYDDLDIPAYIRRKGGIN